jgi:RimJ/RimL family protein N-acetyltransferase
LKVKRLELSEYPCCSMRFDTDFEPLVTKRLLLRRSWPEDAEAISAYRRDPDVHRYQRWERTDPDGILAHPLHRHRSDNLVEPELLISGTPNDRGHDR